MPKYPIICQFFYIFCVETVNEVTPPIIIIKRKHTHIFIYKKYPAVVAWR